MNAQRKQRVSRIRRGVIAGSLATFAAAWGVVFFDGGQGQAQPATPVPAVTSSPSNSSSGSSDNSGSSSNSTPATPSAPLPPVTTQQS